MNISYSATHVGDLFKEMGRSLVRMVRENPKSSLFYLTATGAGAAIGGPLGMFFGSLLSSIPVTMNSKSLTNPMRNVLATFGVASIIAIFASSSISRSQDKDIDSVAVKNIIPKILSGEVESGSVTTTDYYLNNWGKTSKTTTFKATVRGKDSTGRDVVYICSPERSACHFYGKDRNKLSL